MSSNTLRSQDSLLSKRVIIMTNLMLPGFGDPLPEVPKDMESLRQSALDCTRCRLCDTRTQVTWGAGDWRSPLMLVAMGPSVKDDQTGGVYTGPAGDELDNILKAAGLDRDMLYLTNAHKCLARQKDDPFNIRAPIKAELRACRYWLDLEFRLVKPKVLVCIGSPTAKWLLGDSFDLDTQHGQWQTGPFETQAMGTFQPTYITRLREHDPDKADLTHQYLITDFRRAAVEAGLVTDA
jgi:uracil-DNA glycosylase